jgi:hypothetical protein
MRNQREGNGVAGALLLIGLGVLIFTNWWWPGIMVVLGIAIGTGLISEGKLLPGLVAAAIFFGIPFLTELRVPWQTLGPMILIGLGVIALGRSFFLRRA